MSLFEAIATFIGVAIGIPIALGIALRKDRQ